MKPPSDWDFEYAPIPSKVEDDRGPTHDLVLATNVDVDPAVVAEKLGHLPDVAITPLFSAHPIFWTRVQSSQPIDRDDLVERLTAIDVPVRYAASAMRGSQRLPPPLDWRGASPRIATNWRVRAATVGPEPETPWRWFLRRDGIDIARSVCGTGAGTRLAVIDNDGRDLDKVDIEAEIPVGIDVIPRAWAHAGVLIGWAIGATSANGVRFRGVAPDASPRLYCIPKTGDEIVSLPLAVLRAVEDGADVILCATYVEGQTSPLLDDALEFAGRVGRNGKGTAIVFPTGREMSSASTLTHSSLSLGMDSPASDPRVFCVGPSSRDGGWFLWRDRRGRLRPFANRGPAIRWLAPGDDMAQPFLAGDCPHHAESSGASGIAAGVLLVVLGKSPELRLDELDRVLHVTAEPVDAARQASDPELADQRDLLPVMRDRDGHNAKHGYGRLNVARACLAAIDPICQALVRIGDEERALSYFEAKNGKPLRDLHSHELARWAARAMLNDEALTHAFSSFVRAVRLSCKHSDHADLQPSAPLLRQIGVLLRLLLRRQPPPQHERELMSLERLVRESLEASEPRLAEQKLLEQAREIFLRDASLENGVSQSGISGTVPAQGPMAPGAQDPLKTGT